jgi:HSP20 family protein
MAESRNTNNPNTQLQTARVSTDDESRLAKQARLGNELLSRGYDRTPFSFMQRFMSDMDQLFGEFTFGPVGSRGMTAPYEAASTWIPRVDMFERGTQLVVHADLPGLRREDVRVHVDDGVLSISGERQHQHHHEQGGVYRCERSYGSFQRSIALPEGVEPDSVHASFDNGVLEVSMPLPKPRAPKGKAIPVSATPAPGGIKH